MDFPQPGRSDQHHELAVADLERDVVDGDHVVAEDLRDLIEDDLRHGASLLLCAVSVGGEPLVGQGSPCSDVRRSRGADTIEAQLGGPDHRRIAEDGDRRRGRDRGDAFSDTVEEDRVVVAEDPAAEHDIDVEPRHAEPADRGGRQRDDLVGLPVDDRARGGVAPAAVAKTTGGSCAIRSTSSLPVCRAVSTWNGRR